MPGFAPIADQAHISVISSVAPKYVQHYSDLTKRNHMLLNMMKQWGNITYDFTGVTKILKIKVRQTAVRTFSNTTNKTFQDNNPYEEMSFGARGYEASDVLKELEYKQNMGETRLFSLYDDKIKNLGEAMVERMFEWIYQDGDLPEYLDGYQGFESVFAPQNVNGGGTDPTASDRVVLPNDTYGGLGTATGTFGGRWSANIAAGSRMSHGQGQNNDWPYGQGSSEYDATSPVLWNYSSTKWGTGSGLWRDNVEEVVSESSNVLRHRCGHGTDPHETLLLVASDMYPDAENYYSSRYRITTPYQGGDMGRPVPQSLVIDGTALKADYGCPSGVGYGVDPKEIEMFNMQVMNSGGPEAMIDIFGPDWSPEHGAYLMRATTFGNLQMRPK